MSTISASTTTTTAYKVTADTTGKLVLQTGSGPTDAVTIDTSQNVGIGTSSPSTTLTVDNKGGPSTATSGGIRVTQTGWTGSYGYLEFDTINTVFKLGATSTSFPLSFQTNGSERMRIDTSGNLLVGTTTATSGYKVCIGNGTGAGGIYGNANGTGVLYAGVDTVNYPSAGFGVGHLNSTNKLQARCGSTGGVEMASGATSWSAISDERLKDIIEPIENAANKVSSLRAVIGKYKTDEEGVRRSFLIAQDVQAVLPEAVSTTKVEKDGEDEYLTVAYTDLIPLLTAAIQEQQAIIEQLTQRIETLEAK